MAFETLSIRNRKVSDKGRSQMQSNPKYGQEMHHTIDELFSTTLIFSIQTVLYPFTG